MNLQSMIRVGAFTLLVILSAAGSAHATDSDKCSAAKMKAASKYAACRLAADAKSTAKGDLADYTKCEAAQAKSWTKIEAKYLNACPTSGDQAQIREDLAAAASCVASELEGPSGSCDMAAQFLCGNGVVDAGEVCDQSNLGAASCASATLLAKQHGTLGCSADCKAFDTTSCIRCPGLFGTVVDGQCWVLGSPGASCEAACAANSMTVSAATLGLNPNTAARCGWILYKLGATAELVTSFVGPDLCGCWTSGPGGAPRVAYSVAQQGSAANVWRACACE